MEKTLRTTFVIYCLYLFVVAVLLSDEDLDSEMTLIKGVLWITAFVFYVIASITLQVMHHRDRSSLWDLLFLLLFPVLVYVILFGLHSIGGRAFWTFLGLFSFLMITGGFILGVCLSPVIARLKGQIVFSFSVIRMLGVKYCVGVMFMFVMVFAALLYASYILIVSGHDVSLVKVIVSGVLLLSVVSLIAWRTYGHSAYVMRDS